MIKYICVACIRENAKAKQERLIEARRVAYIQHTSIPVERMTLQCVHALLSGILWIEMAQSFGKALPLPLEVGTMLKRMKWVSIAAAIALAPLLATDDAAHANVQSVYVQHGVASWYGPGFHGRKTASGERFNQYDLTAAHKKLPLGTKATVTNLKNGKTIQVEINDRGPYARGRIIDLSKAAADRLGMKKAGTTPVRVEVIGQQRAEGERSS